MRRHSWIVVVGPALLIAAGCGGRTAEPPASTVPAPSAAPSSTRGATTTGVPVAASTVPATSVATTGAGATSVRIYLVRSGGVAPVRRSIAPTAATATAALGQLIAGPNPAEVAAGYSSNVPIATAVTSISIAGGTAVVDLGAASFGAGGGSLSQMSRVAQVVFTLTQFPSVERVRILLDGKAGQPLGGEGLLLDHDFSRREYYEATDLMPRILVESPLPNDTVGGALRITGLAEVFEATFNIQLIDAAGVTVYDKPAMTSEGQTMAPFDVTVTATPTRAGLATLRVFDYSAKDGSVQHLVEIPIVVT
jgi:germination protein M